MGYTCGFGSLATGRPLCWLSHMYTRRTTTQTPYKLVHVSKAPVFTPAECQKVIDEVEEVAAARGWTTRRHFGTRLLLFWLYRFGAG